MMICSALNRFPAISCLLPKTENSNIQLGLVLGGKVFATIPLPGLARGAGKASGVSLAALLAVLLGAFYIEANHSRYREYFPNPISEPAEIAYFVRDNTEYRNIVFCHSFEIPALSVEFLSYSNKRVYPAQTLEDIHRKARRLDELNRDYMINLLVLQEDQELSARMRGLMSRGHETRSSGSLRLVRIEPEAFRRLIRDSEVEPSRVLLRNDTHEHCCPVKSRIESIGWGHRGIRLGSRMAGVPVKGAFFRIA